MNLSDYGGSRNAVSAMRARVLAVRYVNAFIARIYSSLTG